MATSKSASDAAKKWTQTASSYVRYFEPTTLVMGRFLLNCMRMQFQKHPLKVIEAGAGTGGLAKELCGLNGLSLDHLYVTDIADGMLEKAQEMLLGLDSVTIEKADFVQLHYGDATFDRYYANMCVSCTHFQKSSGLSSFVRCLASHSHSSSTLPHYTHTHTPHTALLCRRS